MYKAFGPLTPTHISFSAFIEEEILNILSATIKTSGNTWSLKRELTRNPSPQGSQWVIPYGSLSPWPGTEQSYYRWAANKGKGKKEIKFHRCKTPKDQWWGYVGEKYVQVFVL